MGKMMGRSTWLAISRMMSSLNEREWVEVPMRTVGWTWRMTSSRRRASLSGLARGQSATSLSGRAYWSCEWRSELPICGRHGKSSNTLSARWTLVRRTTGRKAR